MSSYIIGLMNIFVLHDSPVASARLQCDKHVVKMVLESAQMLCAVFPNGDAPYKRAYYNHPCTKWTRESLQNYEWHLKHAMELALEYNRRYDKIHKSFQVIKWCSENYESLNLPDIGMTPFAQAMPDEYKHEDPVEAYRAFYEGEKMDFAKWDRSEWVKPRWLYDMILKQKGEN